MKTITVAELRQNPTAALRDVAAGESYVVTRHRREIARLVPPVGSVEISPPKRSGGARLTSRSARPLHTASSVDELLADMESDW